MQKREQAMAILRETRLLEELSHYGEPHIIGSVRMDLMAVNDIDIDILNTGMNLEKLYRLVVYVLKTFRPRWFEAKEEATDEGKTVWFCGFICATGGEEWNFDLWFFDQETIDRAEAFCDGIACRMAADPAIRQAIIEIKAGLHSKGLYRWDLYHSMDVYSAVLDQGVRTLEAFLEKR